MRLIVLCILFSSVFAPMAWAAAPMDVCELGENTADHIACMKKRYDEAQAALNKIYDRSVRGYEADESTVDLQRAQQDWLAYRDQECARQVEAEETQSLKRVKGLSCSAALTMQRVDILESQLKDHEKDDGWASPF